MIPAGLLYDPPPSTPSPQHLGSSDISEVASLNTHSRLTPGFQIFLSDLGVKKSTRGRAPQPRAHPPVGRIIPDPPIQTSKPRARLRPASAGAVSPRTPALNSVCLIAQLGGLGDAAST